MSVQGEYAPQPSEDEEEPKVIHITHGHSKDNHPELHQFIISLVTNQHGIPCCFEILSGNQSDKESLLALIKKTVASIQSNLSEGQKAIYIADSAVYTLHNIQAMGSQTRFISRAPSTLGFVKDLEQANLSFTPTSDDRYALYLTTTDYGNVAQTLAVMQSQPMKKEQLERFERKRETLEQEAQKELRKLRPIPWPLRRGSSTIARKMP